MMEADAGSRDVPTPQGLSRKAWSIRSTIIVPAVLISGLLSAVVATNGDTWRLPLLVFVGALLGATLFLTDFGFSSAYRRAANDGDFSSFRAHALMFAVASAIMVPLIHAGSLLGQPIYGIETPIGVSLVCGALLFGIGMQMAGGCASGTLFLLGSGNLTFLLTLVTFVIGSTLGAAHIGFWHGLPAHAPITVFSVGPWPIVLGIEVLVLVAAWRWLPSRAPPAKKTIIGAVGLASLNVATLAIAGRPWSETYGFSLWGSKIAAHVGFQPSTWEFWGDGSVLHASLFQDVTSVMDFSIVLGAMLASGLASRFQFRCAQDWQAWLSAAAGGLMMGYGARLADGCNIGAYFSAIVSGSFSGYVWAAAAIIGSMIGIAAKKLIAASPS